MNDSNATETPRLGTAKEAAQLLSISERTLWDMAQSGAIPRVKVGRLVRYDPRDLQAWIDSAKVRAGSVSDEQGNAAI